MKIGATPSVICSMTPFQGVQGFAEMFGCQVRIKISNPLIFNLLLMNLLAPFLSIEETQNSKKDSKKDSKKEQNAKLGDLM